MKILGILGILGIILVWLVWFVYFSRRMVQHLHMMQQNSYRTERFLRWLKPRAKSYLLKRDLCTAIILLLAGYYLPGEWFIGLSLIVMVALNIFWHRPAEKLPLNFTDRAKRLYCASLALTLIISIFPIYLMLSGFNASAVYFGLLAYLSPYVHVLATMLMKPVEAKINQGFFDDAKRIIRERPDLMTIGITGSYGKTSSKLILGSILSESKHTLVTPNSYNTPMGVTITIRNMLKPIHQVFIAEMGARQAGDIKELCDLVQPKIGILTAIGPQHLETFGNIETVAKTKFELIHSLPTDGIAVLNMDDPLIEEYSKEIPVQKLTYSLERRDVDYWAEDITFSAQGMEFKLVTKSGESQLMRTQLLGRHNIYNILAGAAVGIHFGMSLGEIARAVGSVPPVPHRLVLKSAGSFTIIDDAFNSNPVGSKMALEVLGAMTGGRKIVITPGMVELGSEEYNKNKEFGSACGTTCDYVILVGKKNKEALQAGLKQVNYPENQVYLAESFIEANNHMLTMVQPGDYVLLENDLPDTYL